MAALSSLWRYGNPDLLVHLLLRQNAPPLLGPRLARQKDLSKLAWLLSLSKPVGKGLEKRIQKGMIKPDCQSINCELNSICMNVRFESEKHFDGFVNLKSLWNPEYYR